MYVDSHILSLQTTEIVNLDAKRSHLVHLLVITGSVEFGHPISIVSINIAAVTNLL